MHDELKIVRTRIVGDPADLAAIFAELGVAYDEHALPEGESGRIECFKGAYRVVINKRLGKQRKRFAAAHELAHFLLHRDFLHSKRGYRDHIDWLFSREGKSDRHGPLSRVHEAQANKLAIQILMPARSIKDTWGESKSLTDDLRISALAEQFMMPRAAMAIRARTLGLVA